MASDEKVLRTLHLKFTLPAADPAQLSAMIKSAKPFYDFFGTTRVHLLQNVDDPARFIQVIEYETDESLEVNRQRIASDPRIQGYLQAWRMPNPAENLYDLKQTLFATKAPKFSD